ncbi:MAG: molybdopterin-dependent oxidoreductase [Gammaproteobacteria bacterium]
MNKRDFLGAAALAGLAPAIPAAAATPKSSGGPALLTITGAITRTNRGPFDPVRDIMMGKQKLSFEKAFSFDFPALQALPSVQIGPTLEYDGKVHTLRGPRLVDVLTVAGAKGSKLALRAVDGYAAALSMQDARLQKWIVATHLDGQPMALGGLGPLWALYDVDRDPQAQARPLAQRFGGCPWALYHIEVTA